MHRSALVLCLLHLQHPVMEKMRIYKHISKSLEICEGIVTALNYKKNHNYPYLLNSTDT